MHFLKPLILAIVSTTISTGAYAYETAQECRDAFSGSPSTMQLCLEKLLTKSPVVKPDEQTGIWQYRVSHDEMTDTKIRSLTIQTAYKNRYGQATTADILIRCWKNTTSIMFYAGGDFLSSHGGWGQVGLRVDKQPVSYSDWQASQDNEALGLWRGNQSIPVIKRMFDAQRLLVQFAPFNDNNRVVSFRIAKLEEAIKPLRKACNW